VPDPNLEGISRRSRSSTRPGSYWVTAVDGFKLQEARSERGLSRNKLASEAGVSVRTMARLEKGQAASCHRATLYRIAAALADDPESMFSVLSLADNALTARGRPAQASQAPASWICSRIFAAQPDQVAEARAFLGRVLHGCPMAYEATVICSELFTNSLRHSRSALPGGEVTIRAEVREHQYAWLEVEDQGGEWADGGRDDESGRGLEVVAALSDYWDIRTREVWRTVCARLDWPESERSEGLHE
jgi:serine/threonine-protein kinase RsbW